MPKKKKMLGTVDMRDWDDDITNEGRDKRPHRGALKQYKQIMADAATPLRQKHLHYIKHYDASKSLPIGGISLRIYRSLVEARQFDEFCRLVPKHDDTKEEKAEKLVAAFIADEDDVEAQRILEKNRLRSPIWRIGYKTFQHHPVGMTKHANNVLNSEGNDAYFSYDGDWKDGKMHGVGIYQFADGHRYEGGFKEGWMEGPATVTYPCNAIYQGYYSAGKMSGEGTILFENGIEHKYEGLWKNGKRHGKGSITYESGLKYEGDFYVGKFHGRGRIHSPSTGFTFEGTFEDGNIRGFGALHGPDGSKDVRHWGGLPATRPFTGAIEQVHRERLEDFKFRLQQDDERFAYVRALRLQDFLQELKAQIAQDRFDKKREKLLDRRRKAKKMMEDMKARQEARQQQMMGGDHGSRSSGHNNSRDGGEEEDSTGEQQQQGEEGGGGGGKDEASQSKGDTESTITME